MDKMNVFHEALETRNQIELCKAGLLNALEKLYGNDEQRWLQALEKARPKMKGLYLIALDELVKTLEKRVRMGSSRQESALSQGCDDFKELTH